MRRSIASGHRSGCPTWPKCTETSVHSSLNTHGLIEFGNPLETLKTHELWNRSYTWPWETVINAVNTLTLINALGNALQLQNAALGNLTITAQGTVLARANVNMWWHFWGVTISGTDPVYRIQAIQMQIRKSRDWSFP